MSGYVPNNRDERKEPPAPPYNGDFDKQPPRPLVLDVEEPKKAAPLAPPAGCVFAKPCTLPDGQIDYPRTAPAELISRYGKTAVLAASSANANGDYPLSHLSGESIARLSGLSLRGLAVAGSAGGAVGGSSAAGGAASSGALITGGLVASTLVGLVALMWPSPMGNSDLYTPEQLRRMTSARTRVRFRIEQAADGTIKAYGFHTAAKTGWEMINVVQFTPQGEEQVADFGGGITLVWTPAVDSADALGIPPLKAGPQVPPIWVYPATDAAAKALENPIYPPEYKDFILVFPAESGIQPLYVVVSLAFEPAAYHGKRDNTVKSKGPENGQEALDNSVQVKPTSPRRIGVDPQTKEIVVFDRTGGDIYHGHVRPWEKLHQDMKNALIKSGKTDAKGNILGAAK
ncbi:S-type pyocin domain-containing protein [Stutzerimonas stutzeri]|uniref:S-type pyocin domain-containing protein n=1 Tax=Stutzerimonas stutzeri TaxID=316 RepID=UPI000F6B8663|nr:S-type pyocin domain-containing protein [Stutzerimonas stutzeri]VEF15490.1 S-type pyocin/colicin family protein [Stutzerimonas stutzeri]